MSSYILKRPIITERSLNLAGKGKYTFEVAPSANKDQIKEAVELQFGVKVMSINTNHVAGKRKRVGKNRRETVMNGWKKAVVELIKGDKIDGFEVEKS